MSSALHLSGDVVNRTGYYTPQVLFVSFVVKQICTSARSTSFSVPLLETWPFTLPLQLTTRNDKEPQSLRFVEFVIRYAPKR